MKGSDAADRTGSISTVLRKLMAHPQWTSADHIMAPQEALDLMLMLRRQKPVYLVRGFNPPGWTEWLERLAAATSGLRLLHGPMWTAEDPHDGLPDWVREVLGRSWSEPLGDALYLTRMPEAATAVIAVNAAGGRPTIQMEAWLLGYPECCVRHHYDKHRRFGMLVASIFRRVTDGDVQKAREFVAADTTVTLTEEERAAMNEMEAIDVAPFTSVNMCPACARDGDSPAQYLGRRQEEFAWLEDPALAGMIGRAHDAYKTKLAR